MECADTIEEPIITREQEKRLYDFLREQCEGDAFRYELIAKKIHRAADGTATDWEKTIATDWLNAMLELEKSRQAQANGTMGEPRVPFAEIRTGQVSNPNYQAFLDTLEQEELDALQSNGPFFAWMHQIRAAKPADATFDAAYVRKCADASLSKRAHAALIKK